MKRVKLSFGLLASAVAVVGAFAFTPAKPFAVPFWQYKTSAPQTKAGFISLSNYQKTGASGSCVGVARFCGVTVVTTANGVNPSLPASFGTIVTMQIAAGTHKITQPGGGASSYLKN